MIDKEYKLLNKDEKVNRQKEISKVFLKLGFIAFGGPAAHISIMDNEMIEKRRWISREKFVDFIGVSNLIPGPNSTEMVMYLGGQRGGVLGLFNAGISFITPAMIITLIFAYLYSEYGTIPQVSSILDGVKPVTIAIIFNALYRLSKTVIKDKFALFFGILTFGLYSLGISEIPLLFLSGIIVMIVKNTDKFKNRLFSISSPLIFLIFLKIGAVLYGSGYVLLAFLEAKFVEELGVLTTSQIIDAVAIGQLKPGPIFTTATFVGYLLSGAPGALLATVGIFLPSFFIVLLLGTFIDKVRDSTWIAGLLDGINIGSLVLMVGVSVTLARESIISIPRFLIFAISYLLVSKFKINIVWLIFLGGIIGWIIG